MVPLFWRFCLIEVRKENSLEDWRREVMESRTGELK